MIDKCSKNINLVPLRGHGGLYSLPPDNLDDPIMNTLERAYRSHVPLIMNFAIRLLAWCPRRGHWRPCHEKCIEANGPAHHVLCKCLPAWCSLLSSDSEFCLSPTLTNSASTQFKSLGLSGLHLGFPLIYEINGRRIDVCILFHTVYHRENH